jgi:hypothetical protein
MGSNQGEIFIYNFLKNQLITVIPENQVQPILFLGTWFTNANSAPLFYSLGRANNLICRNNFTGQQPLFELQLDVKKSGGFLGGYISVVFNVGVLVYKKMVILVSLFSSSKIASLYFQENGEGKSQLICVIFYNL